MVKDRAIVEAALNDELHALAQPLTALAFLTEMARMQGDPAVWKSSLEAAAVETVRAIHTQRALQQTVARLIGSDGVGL